MNAELLLRECKWKLCQSWLVLYSDLSKVEDLEREVNSFKAKFVTLLSDKFKVVVPSEFVCVSECESGGLCRPSRGRGRDKG